jgi:spermidine synthase
MSHRLLFFIVFIEGYCSLGAEIIALRRLTPHLGSSIIVTAPTIGCFLLALAWGYHAGSKVSANYRALVARNFLIAALLTGLGLAGSVVDHLFAGAPPVFAYLIFVSLILGPIAWLLGQTVPILTNLMHTQRSGEAAGQALFWSTLGSFLGSVSLSLGMMQVFGVWAAVLLGSLLLVGGALLVAPREQLWPLNAVAAILVAVAASAVGLQDRARADTAYADYRIVADGREGMVAAQAFVVNHQTASLLDQSEPPRYARYIRHLRQILLDDLAWRDRDILVLGAGGFTLSHRETANRYLYVDIDPAIRAIAERDFLGEAVRGEFVVADARRYVQETARRFDAIVVDVYSARTAIPGHLLTQEFWRDLHRPLKPDGMLLANLVLDGPLASDYARNLLATIESAWGRCAVEVLDKDAARSNVILTCRPGKRQEPSIYRDERNRADLDSARAP